MRNNTVYTKRHFLKQNERFWFWLAHPEESVKVMVCPPRYNQKYTVVNIKAWLHVLWRLNNAMKPVHKCYSIEASLLFGGRFCKFSSRQTSQQHSLAAPLGCRPSLELQSEEISGFWERPHEDPRAGLHLVNRQFFLLFVVHQSLTHLYCDYPPTLSVPAEQRKSAVTEEQQPIVLL